MRLTSPVQSPARRGLLGASPATDHYPPTDAVQGAPGQGDDGLPVSPVGHLLGQRHAGKPIQRWQPGSRNSRRPNPFVPGSQSEARRPRHYGVAPFSRTSYSTRPSMHARSPCAPRVAAQAQSRFLTADSSATASPQVRRCKPKCPAVQSGHESHHDGP